MTYCAAKPCVIGVRTAVPKKSESSSVSDTSSDVDSNSSAEDSSVEDSSEPDSSDVPDSSKPDVPGGGNTTFPTVDGIEFGSTYETAERRYTTLAYKPLCSVAAPF